MHHEATLYTFGLIGEDVAKSLSPKIHGIALEMAGIKGTYLTFSVARDEFKETVLRLKDSHVSGLNITIPFKEAIIELLDGLSPDARDIGAVNTVKIEEGMMTGHNTDATGFMKALADMGEDVRGKRALVLGSGGASRAVCYGLLRSGIGSLTIASRIAANAINLTRSPAFLAFSVPLRALPLVSDIIAEAAEDSDIIVNATPLGSERFVTASPLAANDVLHAGQCVMDLVYSPARTVLLAQAERAGARGQNGKRMLVHQALASLKIWLDVEVDPRCVFERL